MNAVFEEALEYFLVLFELVKRGLFLMQLSLFKFHYLVLLEAVYYPGEVSFLLEVSKVD